MAAARLCASVCVLCAVSAAQVTTQLYLDKSVFARGEPIFLRFEIHNDGPRAVNILSADPYSFCSGYVISVSSDTPPPEPHSSCERGIAGSCLSSDTLLKPGATKIESILLNFEHDVSNPGDYEVDASRTLPYADAALEYFKARKQTVEVKTRLYFRIDESSTIEQGSLQRLVDQLHSRDDDQRREAARALASLAPPTLEDTLLTFAYDREFRQFAPLAFHRLNTPRSMAAMAELLTKAGPGTYEHMTSADYLSQSEDPRWFPLLQQVAKSNATIGNYVADAADLGGDQMIPTLLELMKSPDNFTRENAIAGLGYTHSPEAVPILIEMLRGAGPSAQMAASALSRLTHRTSSENPAQSFGGDYQKWSQWWHREHANAPIYRGSECGETKPLS